MIKLLTLGFFIFTSWIFASFCFRNNVKSYISVEGNDVRLTLFDDGKFRLYWDEGLLDFDLSGSYSVENGRLNLIREDAYFIEKELLFEENNKLYFKLFQISKNSQQILKSQMKFSNFDSILEDGMILDTSSTIFSTSKRYNFFIFGREIEIDAKKNNFYKQSVNFNLNFVYPNYLIKEDTIIMEYNRNLKNIKFQNLFPNKKLVLE